MRMTHTLIRTSALGALLLLVPTAAPAEAQAQAPTQAPTQAQAYSAKDCPSCAAWNAPHAPVRLFGNTYYVGTDGLSALLDHVVNRARAA